MDFLLGIIFILLGMAILRYRYLVYEFTGEWGWANQYLGGNGTIIAIVLIGMFFIGFGTAYALGMVDLSQQAPQVSDPNVWR